MQTKCDAKEKFTIIDINWPIDFYIILEPGKF